MGALICKDRADLIHNQLLVARVFDFGVMGFGVHGWIWLSEYEDCTRPWRPSVLQAEWAFVVPGC